MKSDRRQFIRIQKNFAFKSYVSFLLHHTHILFIFIYFLLNSSFSNEKENSGFIKLCLSEIKLKIFERGYQSILSDEFPLEPSDVLVNDRSKKNECSKKCRIDEDLSIITITFKSQITTCHNMFHDLTNIKEIDLSKFDASQVSTMYGMFEGCTNLEKIIFGNIKTSLVENMEYLFQYCKKMLSIDVSKFDTSLVTAMTRMFGYCESLTSLDVSNFNTAKVENMFDIFGYCYNLVTINVSSFDTSNVKNMQGMFYHCFKLKYLDLSNFKTSSVTNIINFCVECNSLIYANLRSFKITVEANRIFPENKKFCFDDIDSKNNIIGVNGISNCSDICFQDNIKIDDESNTCVEQCDRNKYEFNKICYKICPNSYPLLIGLEIKCSETIPDNFYFDSKEKIYKECFQNCEKCNVTGNITNNNCLKCKNGYMFLNDYAAIYGNCYIICDYYYYFDETNNYICSQNNTCPEKLNKLIIPKKKCINKCKNDDIYLYEYNNVCYEKCPKGTKTFELIYMCFNSSNNEEDKIISNFIEQIMNGELDDVLKDISENKEDYIQRDENIIYQITTSENQKNHKTGNISTIDLGKCEKRLRDIYGINETLPLIIFKIDYSMPDILVPIIGYEIYHPLNKTKLDMKNCEEFLIQLNIPVSIDEENIFKYDPNDNYYTDNCYSHTTDNKTDIIISDRKKEFSDNNLSLCENNCNYNGYSQETKHSYCNCNAKNNIDLISKIKENPDKIMKDFSSEETNSYSSTVITMKCTKTLFTKNGLLYNISSYIIIFIFTFFLLSIILFMKCGYYLLKQEIGKILQKKIRIQKQKKMQNSKNMTTERTNKLKKRLKGLKGKKKKRNDKGLIDLQKNNNRNIKEKNKWNSQDKLNKKNNLPKNKNIKKDSNKTLLFSNKEKKSNKNINVNFNLNDNKMVEYNDSELNNLSYQNAILYDKRTCCQYYIYLLKSKIPILFGFYPQKDNNSKIIKMCIFFLTFSIYYAINIAFFNEKIIHNIFEKGGKYDIIYFIPRISLSFAISHIISIIIKYIFLSERNLLNVKIQTSMEVAEKVAEKEKRNLFWKYVIFFISGIIFLLFFWLLLSSFGAVYKNTQLFVFENTLISFAISFIYEIFINIFPCVFRIPSLNSKEKNKEYIYRFSRFLQII